MMNTDYEGLSRAMFILTGPSVALGQNVLFRTLLSDTFTLYSSPMTAVKD